MAGGRPRTSPAPHTLEASNVVSARHTLVTTTLSRSKYLDTMGEFLPDHWEQANDGADGAHGQREGHNRHGVQRALHRRTFGPRSKVMIMCAGHTRLMPRESRRM